jgi:hypothetical protein
LACVGSEKTTVSHVGLLAGQLVQSVLEHTPAQQLKVWQSSFLEQALPVALGAPHTPRVQTSVPQQSVSSEQVLPVAAQQAPPTQLLPLQQVAEEEQAPPGVVHDWHAPWVQMPEQHWLDRVHVALSSAQARHWLL